MARFNRHYFIPLAVLCSGIVAAYTWSGFPYDNLCTTNSTIPQSYVGSWTLQVNDNITTAQVTVDTGATNYAFCDQAIGVPPRIWRFPPRPVLQQKNPSIESGEFDEWMTNDQELIVRIYGMASVGIVILIAIYILYLFSRYVARYFRDDYKVRQTTFGKNKETKARDSVVWFVIGIIMLLLLLMLFVAPAVDC